MDYSLWLSAIFWQKYDWHLKITLRISFHLKITLRISFQSSFDADHNGTIPSFISHSHTKIQCVSLDSNSVFAVLQSARMELSNDVHFAIAVHQNTTQSTEDI